MQSEIINDDVYGIVSEGFGYDWQNEIVSELPNSTAVSI